MSGSTKWMRRVARTFARCEYGDRKPTVRSYVKITLRQMADMTSGIASYTEDKQWVKEWLSDPTRVWAPEELARTGIGESPLFEPGTGWLYSNTNYVLLGLVLEKVTNKPIGDLYREQIIDPLGLRIHPSPSPQTLPFPSRMPKATPYKERPSVRNPSTLPTGAPPRHGRPV